MLERKARCLDKFTNIATNCILTSREDSETGWANSLEIVDLKIHCQIIVKHFLNILLNKKKSNHFLYKNFF